MTVGDLKNLLIEMGIKPGYVAFLSGGTPQGDQYCLSFDQGMWEVYYFERDNKNNLHRFIDEGSACLFLLSMLQRDKSAFWVA